MLTNYIQNYKNQVQKSLLSRKATTIMFHFVLHQVGTKISEKSLTMAFNLDTTSTYLFTTSMDTNSHIYLSGEPKYYLPSILIKVI